MDKQLRIVKIPLIRKKFPALLAEELCSVQPMTANPLNVMKLKVTEGFEYTPGDIVHDFIQGYGIIDNDKEFVPFWEFNKRPLDFEI